jgi:hypothetical protein
MIVIIQSPFEQRTITTHLSIKTSPSTVTNVVEDLDGDETEDHYDDDIDGDGLSNADELLYNSDPWDASSINRPPSDINASNLTIAENSAIGTVIGEFNATDPDGEGNITFSLVTPLPSTLNLSLWLDASDASTIIHSNGSVGQWADKSGNSNHATQSISNEKPSLIEDGISGLPFDYETDDRNYSITVRATDDHNVSFDKNFTITVTNVVKDLDGDGTEDSLR